jgi:hypothetical protein
MKVLADQALRVREVDHQLAALRHARVALGGSASIVKPVFDP